MSRKSKALRVKKIRKEHDSLVMFWNSPKPHVFDSCGSVSCIRCGRSISDSIHLRSHVYQPNYNSKLLRCMCGLREKHPIHKKG